MADDEAKPTGGEGHAVAWRLGKPTDLGVYLIQEMTAKGFTVPELATAAGMSPGTVTAAIWKRATVGAETCAKLAGALGVPFTTIALLGGCVDADTIEPPPS